MVVFLYAYIKSIAVDRCPVSLYKMCEDFFLLNFKEEHRISHLKGNYFMHPSYEVWPTFVVLWMKKIRYDLFLLFDFFVSDAKYKVHINCAIFSQFRQGNRERPILPILPNFVVSLTWPFPANVPSQPKITLGKQNMNFWNINGWQGILFGTISYIETAAYTGRCNFTTFALHLSIYSIFYHIIS